ncbi:uncharacterized protein [Drosophila tropicalis]|uniref:uncharacterized protein n=1 Tax=Drosophila tropicalis TaxID=46794 RepID=UPI0035AB6CE5
MAETRSEMEVWELRAALFCCVGLFMANANVLPMKWSPDSSSTLITISTVILLHLLRVKKTPRVTKAWHICVDVVLYYFGNQVILGLIWEQFSYALEYFKNVSTETQDVLDVFMKRLSWLAIVKTDIVFVIKTGLALLITYKAMRWASFLHYILPMRQPEPQEEEKIPKVRKKPTRGRKPSKQRSRSRSRSRKRRAR